MDNSFFVLSFISEYDPEIRQIATIIWTVLSMVFLKKIIDKIDGKSIISTTRAFVKAIILAIIGLIIFIVFILIMQIPILSNLIFYEKNIVAILILILGGVLLFISYIYFLLYFSEIYYTRDMNIIETIKYSSYLSKGNRLRKLVPNFIILFVVILILGSVSQILFLSEELPVIYIFIVSIISISMRIIGTIISAIIFLNVEYISSQNIDVIKSDEENII